MAHSITQKISPGDVVLTNSRRFEIDSLPIKVANFFKRGYALRGWTHAALYIGNNEIVEASPGAVVRRSFEESYLRGSHNVLILRRRKASQPDLEKAIAFCTSENGKKYDGRALIYFLLYNFLPPGLHFLLGKKFMGDCFNVRDAYFCSELISAGFLVADIYTFDREPYKIMPIDFYNELWFDVVDRIEVPKKETKVVHYLKGAFYRLMYFVTAVFFPFLIMLIAALIITFVVLVIYGLFGLIILILSMLRLSKKKEDSASKIDDKADEQSGE